MIVNDEKLAYYIGMSLQNLKRTYKNSSKQAKKNFYDLLSIGFYIKTRKISNEDLVMLSYFKEKNISITDLEMIQKLKAYFNEEKL